MQDLQVIKNVKCFVNENGVVQLSLEDVARGLGFIQTKNNVDYVRWETINGYLVEFGFSQLVGKESFIPENIFYKLAFKASNETARKFQDIVCDEILPTIRKHGMYATNELLNNPDLAIKAFTALKEERERNKLLESKLEQDKPKVLFAESVQTSKTTILIGELAKILKQNGIDIGQNRLFQKLRDLGYLISRKGTDYNSPTQKSMDLGLFEIKETAITHSDGHVTVSKTTKVTGKGQVYFVSKLLEKSTA